MQYLSYDQQVKLREEEGFSKFIDTAEAFTDYASAKGVRPGSINYIYREKIGMLACSPGITGILLSKVEKDKDGLYSMKTLLKSMHKPEGARGCLEADRFILLFSLFFRRGYYANMNWTPYFVDVFWNHCEDECKDCFIRLDEDRVKISKEKWRYIELDTWYGPKFKGDIESIIDGNTKLAIPPDLSERMTRDLFSDLKFWDVNWSTSGVFKKFQAMEFKDKSVKVEENSISYHPVRYMHSIYDMSEKSFKHIDGAMLLLTPEEYSQGKGLDFNKRKNVMNGFKPKYKKLFKINGNTGIDEWIDIVSHFYHGNSLVHEYFTGSLPERFLKFIEEYREGTGFYR